MTTDSDVQPCVELVTQATIGANILDMVISSEEESVSNLKIGPINPSKGGSELRGVARF